MIKNKRVLITGCTGFIGANLARELLKLGAEVHILARATSNKWRIGDILGYVRESYVDLLDCEKLEKIVFNMKPEIVLHTATYGGYPFQKDVSQVIQTNIMGTVNLVNACSKVGFDIFVNTGSSSEYGIKDSPMRETDLLEPNNDYGVSKASATLFCQAKAKSERLPIVTLRLFSPYGYYEEPTRLIPSVIVACLRGENPKVSSPDPVRDFIFIEDVINIYMRVIKTSDIDGEIFNIGYGKQQSVGGVVNKIVGLIGNNVRPEWGNVPKRANEPNVWQADITKAKDVLKWEPKYSLEKGLHKTVKWFVENMALYEGIIDQEVKL
jgi:nucleoside-diphosphate-sugar epimerase